ncbi:MAG: outer membrane lipoprotein carrier protein LolA, partial [Betaproteobacteria bacterium]|nr:outer membrane lipoprotein carrier protein LolA [Betaproteobacteria bacterium]
PNDQLVLADGESLWIYDRDLEQVSLRPLRAALEGLPTGILLGSERVLEGFRFEGLPDSEGLQWLKATAMERQGLTDQIRIGFAQAMPQVLQLTDLGGRGMRYEFSNWQMGPIPAAQFRFVMPKGVDLIRMAR